MVAKTEQSAAQVLAIELGAKKDISDEDAQTDLKARRAALTKAIKGSGAGARPRIMVDVLIDGKPVNMPRAEYIKLQCTPAPEGAGRTRGDVAKELGIVYQIVFAATKGIDGIKKAEAKPKAEKGYKVPQGGARAESALLDDDDEDDEDEESED